MSYSFTVTANTKEDATRQIREQLEAVVLSQPTHAADKETAVVAAQSFVRILADPTEGVEIYVNMYGSLSWRSEVSTEFLGATMTINATLRAKTS